MSNQIERRTIPCEFRVSKDSGKPVIFGYAAKFGVRSDDLGGWVEVIAPDAFNDDLATSPDVRALFNHDANLILGRTTAGTLKLNADKVGLGYEVDPPDTQVARDLITSMERKDITQSSFGFICQDSAWGFDEVNGLDIRTVKKAQLFDVSPVTYPAYPDATSGVRSLPTDMPVEVRTKLNARRPTDKPAEKRDDPNADPKCACACEQCQAGSCGICSNQDCSDEYCSCKQARSLRRLTHSKKVDGENLTADCFLVVGDPEKTDTWHLPWKFSDEEKTKSHLRDALARFDQVEGLSAAEKKAVHAKLVKLCEEHGIDVSADDSRSWQAFTELRIRLAQHIAK